jgi:hypothetical protein
MPGFDIVRRWKGRVVLDRTGDKLGRLAEVYYDAEADQPGWGLVNTADIGVSMRLVWLGEAVEAGGAVRVPHARATVLRAPGMQPGGRLVPQEEAALYAYYGLPYSGASLADLDEPADDDEADVVEDMVGAARWRRRVGRYS